MTTLRRLSLSLGPGDHDPPEPSPSEHLHDEMVLDDLSHALARLTRPGGIGTPLDPTSRRLVERTRKTLTLLADRINLRLDQI